jgi:hypothetical protein
MWACATLRTWKEVHLFLWKWLSLRAFHKYHRVNKVLHKVSSKGFGVIRRGKAVCTPSSWLETMWVGRGGEAAQTWEGRSHLKNKWTSFSIWPQLEQRLFMWVENLPAHSPVGRALLMSLQAKDLRRGGITLLFQTFCRMRFASRDELLEPWVGKLWLSCAAMLL